MISVIVPVYNVSAYLRRCLDSVLAQTYQDLEIIIVDDGSTDEGPAVCDEYARLDDRVRVVHQQNAGLSGARNAGIDLAGGEYLAFVDSDDCIHPLMYETLLKYAAQTGADMTVSQIVKVPESEMSAFSFNPVDETALSVTTFDTRTDIFEQLKKRDIQTVVAWNKLYRRHLFENLRYPVGRVHEDTAVIHEILWNCKCVTYVDVPLYCYVQHDSGIMGHALESEKSILDGIASYKDRISFLSDKGDVTLALMSKTMLFDNLCYKFGLLSAEGYTGKCARLGGQAAELLAEYGEEGLSADAILLARDSSAYYNTLKRREKSAAIKSTVKKFLRKR